MTTAEYRKAEGLNFSSLKHILKSPAHFKSALEIPTVQTDAMLLGTLAHSVILEGKSLNQVTTVKPDGLSLATKEGKAWKLEQDESLPIISADDAAMIEGMANGVLNNIHAAHLLKQCQHRETPIFANVFGAPCKALLDAHGTDGVEWIIVDLKTTDDASPDAFGKKVANLDYDFQAAFYSAILAQHHQIETRPYWIWIAVEKKPPFCSAVYSAEEWLDSGDAKMEKAIRLWKECNEKSEWPMPYRGMTILKKPAWA